MFSPSISLLSVLYVPNLSHNLLSVSIITKSLNCLVTFFPTNCIIHDLGKGKMIGSGRNGAGVYFLEKQPNIKS